MAINVDTVYKTVLLILNKEQRGYMTPDEFNKTATQVQLEIFEEYFDSLNQQLRVPDNDSEYADRIKNIQEKIAIFQEIGDCEYIGPYFNVPASSGTLVTETITTVLNQLQYTLINLSAAQLASGSVTVSFNGIIQPETEWSINGNILSLTTLLAAGISIIVTIRGYDFYKLGTVIYNDDKEVQYVQPNELLELNLSALTKPTKYYPVYKYKDFKLYVYPNSIIDKITTTYLRKPLNPSGNFTATAPYYQYIYSPSSSVNFELHPVEQTTVITKILLYSGIVIKDPQIVQIAAQQVQAEQINSKS
jgi:hypothetical protein